MSQMSGIICILIIIRGVVMNIGEKIKTLRQQNGLSQEGLANKLGVSRQAITKWETNRGIPDIENLKSLSDLFNVSLDYLVSEDNNELSIQTTEKIHFEEYSAVKHFYKCIEDCVVLHKYPQALKIFPLVQEKRLSRLEKAFEWLFMPFFGAFDIIDKLNNKRKSYLIDNNGQSFLVTITKDMMETSVLPYTVIDKQFVHRNYKYTKLDVEGISELISWKKKNITQ